MMIIGCSLNKNISRKAILYQKIRSCLIFFGSEEKWERKWETHLCSWQKVIIKFCSKSKVIIKRSCVNISQVVLWQKPATTSRSLDAVFAWIDLCWPCHQATTHWSWENFQPTAVQLWEFLFFALFCPLYYFRAIFHFSYLEGTRKMESKSNIISTVMIIWHKFSW